MTSVQTLEKFSVYWNYQVWHLAAGEQVDGGLADHLLATGSPVEQIEGPAVETAPPVDAGGDGVPDSTAKDVLAWVGDDPGRAALALDAELRREPPRTTLVTALAKLAPTQPEPDPEPAPPAES